MVIIPKEVLYRKMHLLHTVAMGNKRQTELFCEWLENFLDYERIRKKGEFSLETMKFLVSRLHHPEATFKSVHVAGSKGKGSVSAMISNIIAACGLPCGLYTSPHLIDFTERIGTASGPFDDRLYGNACDILVPQIDSIIPESIPGGMEPSWFELVTLFAFVVFREAGIPWAVIETGLGGRLDATNVIIPEASVLTPIELEHTEYLGSTVEDIAMEKAGIIKAGVPVFLSPQRPSVRALFEKAAREKGCPSFSMEDAVASAESSLTTSGLDIAIAFRDIPGGARFSRPILARLSMVNSIQVQNAALAAYAAKYLFPDIAEETIELGLSRAWLPGRFEIVTVEPLVVLDGAHTVRSIELTLETFLKIAKGRHHLLFACAADKDVESIAGILAPAFSHITLTRPGEKKTSDIDLAERAFRRHCGDVGGPDLFVDEDYVRSIKTCLERSQSTGIPLLVTGSFYLVAEVKKILQSPTRDRES